MRNMVNSIRYRFGRLNKLYVDEGGLPALRSLFRQISEMAVTTLQYSWRRIRYPEGIIETQTEVGTMLLSCYDRGVSMDLLKGCVREPLLVDLIRNEIKPGMCGFDVGSNIGYYVLLEDALVGETGRIVACEPVPETAALLSMNVQRYCSSDVTVERIAVSSQNGSTRITHGASWNTSRVVREASDSESGISVCTETLDSLSERGGFEKVDFIRMDIEGHEIEATKGMKRVLAQANLKLFMEIHNPLFDSDGQEVRLWLEDLFRSGLKPCAFTGGGVLHWETDERAFVQGVTAQKRSCVHVFLQR